MSTKFIVDESFPAFLYHINYVLRNVIPCNRIGELYGDSSIIPWAIKNKFNRVFSISSAQISGIDLSSLSKLATDVVVGLNPFKDLDVCEIETALGLLDSCLVGCLLGIPTREYHVLTPKLIYCISDWCNILSQVGKVVNITNYSHWSLFLVLK